MSNEKLYKNKDYLTEQYIINKKSIEKISKEINCSIDTVYRWLLKFNIPIRNKSEANKGKMPWSKGLTKFTDERLNNISIKLIEINSDVELRNNKSKLMKQKWDDPIYHQVMSEKLRIARNRPDVIEKHKKASEEFRSNFSAHKKISTSVLKLWDDPEWRERNISSVRTPEIRKARSIRAKQMWEDPYKRILISSKISETIGSAEYQEKITRNFTKRPTRPEKILYNYIILYGEWEYSGNGSFWIELLDKKHRKNPDFKNEFENKVIEVFGDYWHKESEVLPLIKAYKEVGWDCIVIWEHDIHNLSSNKEFLDFLCCNKTYIDKEGKLVFK